MVDLNLIVFTFFFSEQYERYVTVCSKTKLNCIQSFFLNNSKCMNFKFGLQEIGLEIDIKKGIDELNML